MHKETDEFMQLAISEAEKCVSTRPNDPKVGAVVVRDGEKINAAFRGETGPGHHAEFALLQKKIRSTDPLRGATLYTTLEPCTTRSHDKLPCAEWIVRKGVGRVVIAILDPNPNICGRGYWHLVNSGVEVEFCSFGLAKKVKELNEPFVAHNQSGGQIAPMFASLVQKAKSPVINQYVALGWGDELSLQDSPNLRDGWPMSAVELKHDDTTRFELPVRYQSPYKHYFEQYHEQKRFKDDGEKFMLVTNPTAFSDSPSLILRTKSTKYSEVQFYRDNVATIAAERNPLIEELVRGSLAIQCPHAFCMHMVVATKDNKMLLTRRSPKVAYYPGTWSCSVEEQLARKDLNDDANAIVSNWGRRLLLEELGIEPSMYRAADLRVLSVFLESDCLNISLCACTRVSLDSSEMQALIQGVPRTDYEFTEWAFMDLERGLLLSELVRPTRPYHPSTAYRFLLTFLKQFGMPLTEEVSGFMQ